MKPFHAIREALTRDAEAVRLEHFGSLSGSVTVHGGKRLAALAELLESRRDRAAAQLYLVEFISKSMRQVGAQQSLFETFAERAAEIPESTWMALPRHTRGAFHGLMDRIRDGEPIPVIDPLSFAHGLTIDGELVRYLSEEPDQPEKPKETPEQVFRRLATKHHPDKGGNPEVMAAINEIRKAMR